jgi:preprotein translocase subunit SecG
MRNKIPARQILAIVMTIAALIGVLLLKQRCGAAMGNLFRAMDNVARDGGHD